jgi:hypothetical protein
VTGPGVASLTATNAGRAPLSLHRLLPCEGDGVQIVLATKYVGLPT